MHPKRALHIVLPGNAVCVGSEGGEFPVRFVIAAAYLLAETAVYLARQGPRLPCWNIDSYWHIGEALRAIESSGKKMKLYCEHAEAEDEESDASESD